MKQITFARSKKGSKSLNLWDKIWSYGTKKNVAILELRYQTEQQFKKSLPN